MMTGGSPMTQESAIWLSFNGDLMVIFHGIRIVIFHADLTAVLKWKLIHQQLVEIYWLSTVYQTRKSLSHANVDGDELFETTTVHSSHVPTQNMSQQTWKVWKPQWGRLVSWTMYTSLCSHRIVLISRLPSASTAAKARSEAATLRTWSLSTKSTSNERDEACDVQWILFHKDFTILLF